MRATPTWQNSSGPGMCDLMTRTMKLHHLLLPNRQDFKRQLLTASLSLIA